MKVLPQFLQNSRRVNLYFYAILIIYFISGLNNGSYFGSRVRFPRNFSTSSRYSKRSEKTPKIDAPFSKTVGGRFFIGEFTFIIVSRSDSIDKIRILSLKVKKENLVISARTRKRKKRINSLFLHSPRKMF